MAQDETGCGIGPEVDPFATVRAGFADLVQALAAPAAAGLPHDRLEELIETGGREVLRQLMLAFDDRQVTGGEPGLAARSGPGEDEPDDTGPDDTGPDDTGPDDTGPDDIGRNRV
jgi:hypothetical protein